MIGINENTELSYLGDDTTADYAVTFPRFDAQEIKVYVEDVSGDGGVTELVEDTHYTTSNILPSSIDATVTLTTGFSWMSGSNNLNTGYKLWIEYNRSAFQDANLSGNGRQALRLVQKILDRFAMGMRAIDRKSVV